MTSAAVTALCIVLAAAAFRPRQRRQSTLRSRRRSAGDESFAEMLDLFVVTAQAGHRPLEALAIITPLVDPAVAAALVSVRERVSRGQRLADALSAITEAFGVRGATFVATLTVHDRIGAALAPALDRLADEARQQRRRAAEAAARTLPVRLSFPLVLCTLPSFVLLAIVPLLLGALSSLTGP